MRIGYLTSQYPATSHTFIRREIEALREQGLAIETFSVRRPDSVEIDTEWDRRAFEGTFYLLPISFFRLCMAHAVAFVERPGSYIRTFLLALRHRAPGMRSLVWALFHFAESIVLAQQLRRGGITHLHNHFANSAANVGLLASRFLDMPWSLTLHGISETDYPAGLLLADKIKEARFVACVSWFGRAQAMRITRPDQWDKFETVRCGVNLIDLPVPAVHTQPLRVICVGRLSSEKGHAGLLEAFASLIARGVRARLVLVGDGPERDALIRQSAALGLEDNVEFAGRKNERDVQLEIAKSDLLVLPSFMEGLPVVLIEAMAIGVPVVASCVAGIPELIDDGTEGLLFRPADWHALSAAMAKLLSDNNLRARIVEAARIKVISEFDIRRAVVPLIGRFVSQAQDANTADPAIHFKG